MKHILFNSFKTYLHHEHSFSFKVNAKVQILHLTGDLHGKDLLEVGCGPSVLFSIVPSQYFNNVYLADYLERNLKIIKTWLDDKPEQINFQPFFDFAGKQLEKG